MQRAETPRRGRRRFTKVDRARDFDETNPPVLLNSPRFPADSALLGGLGDEWKASPGAGMFEMFRHAPRCSKAFHATRAGPKKRTHGGRAKVCLLGRFAFVDPPCGGA